MCVLCWQFLTESHWTDRRFEDHDSTTAMAAVITNAHAAVLGTIVPGC